MIHIRQAIKHRQWRRLINWLGIVALVVMLLLRLSAFVASYRGGGVDPRDTVILTLFTTVFLLWCSRTFDDEERLRAARLQPCPYCAEPIRPNATMCRYCTRDARQCPACLRLVRLEKRLCPHCGATA